MHVMIVVLCYGCVMVEVVVAVAEVVVVVAAVVVVLVVKVL